MAGRRSDVGDDEADQDRPAVQQLLVEELAAPVLELSDRRLAQGPAAATGKIETPLMGFRVVEPQAESFDVTRRAVDDKLDQIGASVQNLADGGRAIVLHPGGRAGEGMHQALQVGFPGADLEVEIVLSVAWTVGLRGGRAQQ